MLSSIYGLNLRRWGESLKIFKNKSILLALVLIILVLFFHTYYWADFYSKTPVDKWSRPSTIGTAYYNRAPLAFSLGENKTLLLYDLEKNIEMNILSAQGEVVKKQEIKPPYEKIDRVKKKDLKNHTFIWQERDLLYKAILDKEELTMTDKDIIKKEIISFDSIKDTNLLLVAKEEEVEILDLNTSKSKYSFHSKDAIKKIASYRNEQGEIFIAYATKRNNITDDIYVLKLRDDKGKIETLDHSKVQTIEYINKFKLGDLNITALENELYLWYEQNKWDSRGTESWVYSIYFPNGEDLSIKEIEKMQLPIHWGKESNYTTKVFPVVDNDQLEVYLASDWAETRLENGHDLFKLKFDRGEIKDINRMIGTDYHSNYPILVKGEEDNLLIWTEVKNSKEYEIKMASTNKKMIKKLGGIKEEDWLKGMGFAFMGFSYSLIYIFVRIIYHIPLLLIFAYLDFFGGGLWEKKKTWILLTGFIVYNMVKIGTFDFYYRPYALEIMPKILQFQGAPWVIPLITSILAILPVLVYYREKKKEENYVSPFSIAIFYSLFNILFTSLIYTSYLVK